VCSSDLPREAPTQIHLRSIRISLAMLLLLGFFGVSPIGAAVQPAGFYVEATGHALGDPFLSYWVDNDGARSLGLPVTDVVSRNGRTAQYFQYGVWSSSAMTRFRGYAPGPTCSTNCAANLA